VIDLELLLRDLTAEGDDLDALVSALPAEQWQRPTPSPGWSIATQIGHLAWTDEMATTAAADPQAFTEIAERFAEGGRRLVDEAAAERAAADPADLLTRWRQGRVSLRSALAALDPDSTVPWFGPPMRAASMATGRIMETWAHGQDVADALGVTRLPTPRLRHVAHLGIRSLAWSFAVHRRTPPDDPIRVELTAPADEVWVWGPDEADQRVTGPALDFALLVTQRRHRDDLALVATGPDAHAWLEVAQAFAGPPGPGRAPGQFR
jgi:uncharacterized protein (TIGR03084 family)